MRKPTSSTQLAAFLFVDSRWHEPHDAVQCRAHGSTFEFLFEFQTEFFSSFFSSFKLFENQTVRLSRVHCTWATYPEHWVEMSDRLYTWVSHLTPVKELVPVGSETGQTPVKDWMNYLLHMLVKSHLCIFCCCCTVHFDNIKPSCTLHRTQYTHHSLKHMLPQHCKLLMVYFYWFILQSVTSARLSISSLRMVQMDRNV
jgi:hypothetical protein